MNEAARHAGWLAYLAANGRAMSFVSAMAAELVISGLLLARRWPWLARWYAWLVVGVFYASMAFAWVSLCPGGGCQIN